MDKTLQKEQSKSILKKTTRTPRSIQPKDANKIGNISRDISQDQDHYFDQRRISPAIRRFCEPSEGDQIFKHKSTKNEYLNDQYTSLEKNKSMHNEQTQVSRRRKIEDKNTNQIAYQEFSFPQDIIEKDKLPEKIGRLSSD